MARPAAQSPAAALRASVIVPATDRPATLERCREAILSAVDPPEEVIVVKTPAGDGPAAARNAGARRATGSLLIFVDSDVIVHPDAISRIRAAFAADPELTAVFGSYDNLPSPHGAVSTFRNLLHHYVHHSSPGTATTFWAGLGAVRRDAFLAVGGFDSNRFPVPSVEDIELGLRLAAAGGRIALDPAIQGTHLKRWRLLDMVVTDLVHRGAPWMTLMLDRGPQAARLNLSGRHGVAAASFLGAAAATAAGRFGLAAAPGVAFLGLNARFYALLVRCAGPRAAAVGVGLHLLHVATALAATPLGALRFGLDRGRRSPRTPAPLTAYRGPVGRWARRSGNGPGRFERVEAADWRPTG